MFWKDFSVVWLFLMCVCFFFVMCGIGAYFWLPSGSIAKHLLVAMAVLLGPGVFVFFELWRQDSKGKHL